MPTKEPKFFTSAAAFRKWLQKYHRKNDELWVGFHKKGSGRKSITYPEALDEALCFGWIDGVRKSVDEESYKIRFSPRRTSSIWSNVNIRHVERLKKLGRMEAAGMEAYALRDPKRTGIYSFEKQPVAFAPEIARLFQANTVAWQFFNAQPPYYRKIAVLFVMSAKREETRLRRLQQLIETSIRGKRLGVIEGKQDQK